MSYYFFSDPHFGHGNILKYSRRIMFMDELDKQSFMKLGNSSKMSDESIRRMNEGIISRINNVVKPNDVLYCLGDWCFSRNKNDYHFEAKKYREQINCRNVHLIFGNHDQYSLRKGVGFSSCNDSLMVSTDVGSFFLSHYPHLTWNKKSRGVMHLYGHVHGFYYENPSVVFEDSWAAFDVGVDVENRYGVWSAQELSYRLRDKVEKAKFRRD